MPENSRAAALRRVYQDALAVGLDEEGARVAMAIAATEGGYGGAQGDADIGGSRGTFQFYFGGGQGNNFARAHGLSQQQADALLARDPHAGNAWALGPDGYLGQAIRRGQAQGLRGADLATYAQRTGQVSVSPERAGANYQTVANEDVGGGSGMASNAPGVSPSQRVFDAVVAAKGDPISIVPRDPQIANPKYPEGPKVDNPTPVVRYTFSDGTYVDVKHAARTPSGVAEEITVQGGTALASVAKPGASGTVVGGQTPNEQYIVTVKPDGSVSQSPNPNYVAPKPAATPGPKTVNTSASEQYIVRENPDGTISQVPNPNYVAPKPGAARAVGANTGEQYIVRENADGTISQIPNPNYVAPKPGRSTHTVGGRAFTLDENGNVVGTADLRTPAQVEREGIDLEGARVDLAKDRQALLPKQQQILQGHQDTIKYVQGMLERGEIDQAQADAYVQLSKESAESALRGFTPFDEMKIKREAETANKRMGTDLLTQRLSSGAGLASSLLSAASSLSSHAMLRPGQAGLGVDPLAQLMPLLGELQGGQDVTPFARGLLMGGTTGPPTAPGPSLPAGL